MAPIPPPRLGPFEEASLASGLRLLIGKHDEQRLVELRLARRFSDASVNLDEQALLPGTQEAS